MEDGLSYRDTGPILKDRDGLVWVGSSNGLNRFDGYQFSYYVFSPEDTFSLPANTLSDLWQAPSGQIWIGTRGGGLARYDPGLDRFYSYPHHPHDSLSLSNDYVNELFQDAEGKLWIATDQGLNEMVHPDDGSGVQFRHHPLPFSHLEAIAEWPQGVLWLGTSRQGLLRYEPATGKVTHLPAGEAGPISNLVKDLHLDTLSAQPTLWVATFGGLTRIQEPEDGAFSFTHYIHTPDEPQSLSHPQVTCIAQEGPDILWAGTYHGGLTRLSIQGEDVSFQQVHPETGDPGSLGHATIHDLWYDESGILWVAHGNGLDKAYIRQSQQNQTTFQHRRLPHAPNGFEDILAIYEDQAGNLWLGTYGRGLYVKVKATGQEYFFSSQRPAPAGISHPIVTTITQDSAGVFWIGTFGGFNRMEVRWENEIPIPNFTPYRQREGDPTALPSNHIFAVLPAGETGYWIGTRGGGLAYFDKARETFRTYRHRAGDSLSLSNDYVWSIDQDARGHLWIATDRGVNCFDPAAETFRAYTYDPKKPDGLSSNYVNQVYVDRQQRVWIGTNGGGIALLDSQQPEQVWLHLRETQGLIYDEIYAFLQDPQGMMWVTTAKGVSRIDPTRLGEPDGLPRDAIRNFDQTDGLQDDEFNAGAAFQNETGTLFLGGINGYNVFRPEDIRQNEHPPQVLITQVRILNETLKPGQARPDGHVPLHRSLLQGGQLDLNHRDLVLTFSFTATNHLYPSQNQYAYRLEGFDSDWRYVGTERQATYTNLSPGEYTFRVKASNNDGMWNEAGTAVTLSVAPPPWKSWWAYSLYALTAAGLIMAFVRFRIRQRELALEVNMRIAAAKREERERVRRHAAADYHDELGNKMTRISLFVEMARRSTPPESPLSPFLQQIEQNTQRLSEGIRDFIWVLDPEQDSVFDLVARMRAFADELLAYTDISFAIQGLSPETGNLKLPQNARRHIVMILKEGMNNTLKYAQAHHLILSLSCTEQELTLSLKDDGQGFDLDAVQKGYGLDNLRRRAREIQARLDIQTAPGAGTALILTIPHMRDGGGEPENLSLKA